MADNGSDRTTRIIAIAAIVFAIISFWVAVYAAARKQPCATCAMYRARNKKLSSGTCGEESDIDDDDDSESESEDDEKEADDETGGSRYATRLRFVRGTVRDVEARRALNTAPLAAGGGNYAA